MADRDCVAFLQWALPRLGLRWPGFRKVRRQVCRRIRRRMAELGIARLGAYRDHLRDSDAEWRVLDHLCRVTISRFFRDRGLFHRLGDEALPALAATARDRGDRRLLCWSVGCASGEEAFSLSLLWRIGLSGRFPDVGLTILATDVDLTVLARARRGVYKASSLREVPEGWRERAFEPLACSASDRWRLRQRFRRGVLLAAHDVRRQPPAATFDLILCRNLAFTYFADLVQQQVGERLLGRLRPGGLLVLGSHESPPEALAGRLEEPWSRCFRQP